MWAGTSNAYVTGWDFISELSDKSCPKTSQYKLKEKKTNYVSNNVLNGNDHTGLLLNSGPSFDLTLMKQI